MLSIAKGKEPKALADAKKDLRSTPNTTVNYRGLRGKQKEAVLDALLEEQGFVCAYCTRSIHRRGDGHSGDEIARIEHYLPQSPTQAFRRNMAKNGGYDADEYSLDYCNMLAVCSGGEGGEHGKVRICDKSRSDTKPLYINPTDEASVSLVAYKRDGTTWSENEAIDYDLNIQLNLNADEFSLRENRMRAIASVDMWVSRLPDDNDLRVESCAKLIQKYKADREAKKEAAPFQGATLWRLGYWIGKWS